MTAPITRLDLRLVDEAVERATRKVADTPKYNILRSGRPGSSATAPYHDALEDLDAWERIRDHLQAAFLERVE